MKRNLLENVSIRELSKDETTTLRLQYKYLTSDYYDLSVNREKETWKITMTLKPFEKALEKISESKVFELHIEEPRVFAAVLGEEQIGWVELGYEKWNNRMRVWEFLVKEEFRRRGVGKLLMNHAVIIAKEKGARMLVLETQSCNVPTISFYLNFGFELVGFDSAAYSNEDIVKREIRLEMGLKLQ